MVAEPRYFEHLYQRYNHPRYIHPDPLEIVRDYSDPKDREIVGLLCASLALGRVDGILKACRSVLGGLSRPFKDVTTLDEATMKRRCRGFVYRFFDEDDISNFLLGIGAVIRSAGSLETCFAEGAGCPPHSDAIRGLQELVVALRSVSGDVPEILLPLPARGSACKRLHLYLRWMVRADAVDPGGWQSIPASALMVPVDTHMLKVARHLGITSRKQADAKTSAEITDYFRRLRPDDPVRYDFVLTRSGISRRDTIRQAVYGANFRVRPAS